MPQAGLVAFKFSGSKASTSVGHAINCSTVPGALPAMQASIICENECISVSACVEMITPTVFSRLPAPVRKASNNRLSALDPNSSQIQNVGASPNAGAASAASER